MKPLLIVPLTLDDQRIWAAIAARQPWLPLDDFWPDFQAAHRRDAALMWRLQRNLIEFKPMRDYLYLIGEWVPCAAHAVLIGADVKGVDPADAFNITNCA